MSSQNGRFRRLAGLALSTGIAWKDFIRAAAPLAALTGILTVPLAPLGLFVLLPANLIWAIARYRRNRPLAIRAGQGARMGARDGSAELCLLSGLLPCHHYPLADAVSRT